MRTIGCSPNAILAPLTWSNSSQVVTSSRHAKPSRGAAYGSESTNRAARKDDVDRFGSHHGRGRDFSSMLAGIGRWEVHGLGKVLVRDPVLGCQTAA